MATVVLDSLILAAARKLKDQRTSAGPGDDTGHVYNSALLTEYANRAVRDFLKDAYKTLGRDGFPELFPEYIKQSGTLTLSSGAVAKPADAFFIVDLVVSDLSLKFDPLPQSKVPQVQVGDAGLDNASATHPKFWEEAGYIKTLGVTTGNVIARYIKKHSDLVVVTDAVGNGIIYTTAANLTWTAATKLLTIASTTGLLDSGDLNKLILFRTSTVVYVGRISAVSEAGGSTLVTLTGDGLPAGNISPSNIVEFVISDLWPDDSDLVLNQNWHGEILDRMVGMGEQDAERLLKQ
jgi:hypothetical protein